MKIIPLFEGAFTVDGTKQMLPFDPEKDSLAQRGKGSLLVGITPFLIITAKDIILLDTGVGSRENGQLKIVNLLAAHNVSAGDVTKVFLSHLHGDHVGGMSYKDEQGARQLTFPNATYYLQRQELAYALSGESKSYHAEDDLGFYREHSQVTFLDGNGNIDETVYYEITGAHSKYHQVFWIREDDEIAFFGADDAPQKGQMRTKFAAKYDYDGKKAMELREQWWETGQNNHWVFLFYHDIKEQVLPAGTAT